MPLQETGRELLVSIGKFSQRIRWEVLFFLIIPPVLTGDLLSGTYFKQNIPIGNSVTASTASLIPFNLTVSKNVLDFPNTYTWQTLFPSFIPFDFLNYSQLCVENHNESYFNGKLVTEKEIDPTARRDNAKFIVSFAHTDGSSYSKFEVPNGNKICEELNPHQAWQILVTVESLTRNDGQKFSEIRTGKSMMYLWPGQLNELFLIGILFLVWSSFCLYLRGLKKLILGD